MKAIILAASGDVSQLITQEIPTPTFTETEVLIKVKAISINPVDIKTRSGKALYNKLKEDQPLILGWDVAGIVAQVGSMVTEFKAGDEVFGMVNFPGHGKAYAEYVVAPAAHLALKPQQVSFEQAAASTLAALTAYQSLVYKFQVKPGQKVLIHAAAGGVGHFAVQLAKHLGAYVIGTSSAKNEEFITKLGADLWVDYHGNDLETKVKAVDFCYDLIGGENIDRSLPLIKTGGTIISIPSGLNDHVEEKAKAYGIYGHTFMVGSSGEDMKAIAQLLERNILVPHISHQFTFAEIAKAHLQIETGRTVGKIVIVIR